ncbi:hypothetical protein JT358_11080 [Micrococcales bacterium 31B]|nr:hypothetical protein [Micrococcales bacterium 31B]
MAMQPGDPVSAVTVMTKRQRPRLTVRGRSALAVTLCAVVAVAGLVGVVYSASALRGFGAPEQWLSRDESDRTLSDETPVAFGETMRFGTYDYTLQGWEPAPATLVTDQGETETPDGSYVLLKYSATNNDVIPADPPLSYISVRTEDKSYWYCSTSLEYRFSTAMKGLGFVVADGPLEPATTLETVALCEGEGTFAPVEITAEVSSSETTYVTTLTDEDRTRGAGT